MYGDHRDLHVLTHSCPTLRSSDLSMPLPPDSTIAVACCLHLRPLLAFTLRRDEALEVEAADHALELVDAFGLSFGLHLEASADHDAVLAALGPDRKSTRLNSSH